MTGNTVLAAIAMARLDLVGAGTHLVTIGAFFAGAMAGRLLLVAARAQSWVPLAVEAAMLAVVAFVPAPHAAAAMLMAVAMGVQATALTRFGGATVSTVVLTSTLARIAEALLDVVIGRRAHPVRGRRAPAGLLALTWFCYAAGAALGALLRDRMTYPLLVAAGIVAVVAGLLAWVSSSRRDTSGG